jgi:hypothetical protein
MVHDLKHMFLPYAVGLPAQQLEALGVLCSLRNTALFCVASYAVCVAWYLALLLHTRVV